MDDIIYINKIKTKQISYGFFLNQSSVHSKLDEKTKWDVQFASAKRNE